MRYSLGPFGLLYTRTLLICCLPVLSLSEIVDEDIVGVEKFFILNISEPVAKDIQEIVDSGFKRARLKIRRESGEDKKIAEEMRQYLVHDPVIVVSRLFTAISTS